MVSSSARLKNRQAWSWDRGLGQGRLAPSGWRRRLLASSALVATLLAATPSLAGPALPSGGGVGAGQATITSSGPASLTVNQSTSRAIINWQTFSIGQGGSVQFNNGSGATLNRVQGGQISSLDGLLSATGSVYLINPNGVIIGKSGVVNTGGSFVASTHDVTNSQFLASGDLTFSGSSNAAVINYGKIGSLGGDVALIASRVENDGVISAPGGDAGLIAGYQIVLRDSTLDDGKFSVLVGGSATSATNTGALQAAEVELRANGGNVYALAGNTGSIIKATGVSAHDGQVFLVAEDGSATASGFVEATGQVETSGATVDFTGLRVIAPHWLVDPADLTIDATAASTISANLATTSITLQTTATGASGPGTVKANGVGDINITAPISWSSANTLTLDAYLAINITAPITVAGAGKAVLTYNDGGSGGDLSFGLGPSGFAGNLSFTGTPGSGQGLTINGRAYTLLYKLTDSTAPTGNSTDSGVDDIAGIDNNTAAGADTGYYALAVNVAGTGTASAAQFNGALAGASSSDAAANFSNPALNGFLGVFEGLGHTVSNLTINANKISLITGLFGENSGVIRDIGIDGGQIQGAGGSGPSADTYAVGALAGENTSIITNVYSTADVSVSGIFIGVGGLVGWTVATQGTASISNAYATGSVTASDAPLPGAFGDLGGLVGAVGDGGSGRDILSNVYATGNVSGAVSGMGGLAGTVDGEGEISNVVVNAYATGAVSGQGGFMGGLIGLAYTTSISDVYATGAVTGSVVHSVPDRGILASYLGGLIGSVYSRAPFFKLTNAYATGAVSGPDASGDGGLIGSILPLGGSTTITNSFATGAVTGGSGADVGGLVGLSLDSEQNVVTPNTAGGIFSNTYATGPVTGGSYSTVGGLIGSAQAVSVSSSYSVGAVSGGAGSTLGGLIGELVPGVWFNTITQSYWDTETTGQSASAGGTPLTTAQLIATLPPGFSPTIWGQVAGVSFPYLLWQFPNGAPDVVAGTVYSAPGGSALAGLEVDGLSNGAGIGSATTGANGYYQILSPQGSIGGAGLLTYLTGPQKGEALADNGSTHDLNIYAGGLNAQTGTATLSAMAADYATALGVHTGPDFLFTTAGGALTPTSGASLWLTTPSFTLDRPLSLGAGALLIQAGGTLFVNAPVSGQTVTLASTAGDISLGAQVTGTGAVTVNSAGGVTEWGSGLIDTASFSGSADGLVWLGKANAVAALAGFSDPGGLFGLTDTQSLTVSAPVTIASTLSLTVSNGAITLDAPVSVGGGAYVAGAWGLYLNDALTTGGLLTLDAVRGGVYQDAASAITAPSLSVIASHTIDLGGANQVDDLQGFTSYGSGFSLFNDARSLTVTGDVMAPDGSIGLSAVGDLTLESQLTSLKSVVLNATGAVAETGAGSIKTGGLNVSAGTGISLTSPNTVTYVGVDHTQAGPNIIVR